MEPVCDLSEMEYQCFTVDFVCANTSSHGLLDAALVEAQELGTAVVIWAGLSCSDAFPGVGILPHQLLRILIRGRSLAVSRDDWSDRLGSSHWRHDLSPNGRTGSVRWNGGEHKCADNAGSCHLDAGLRLR